MSKTDTDRFNPFPGLRPFEQEEDFLFFGREQQTDDLLQRLRKTNFLAVVGASGSGKSSLVRAGLLPALDGGFMLNDGSAWRVAMFRPGGYPIRAMAESLAAPEVLGPKDVELAAYQSIIFESTLERGSLGLVELFDQTMIGVGKNLLVVVDQFEELFRFQAAPDPDRVDDEAAAFIKLLLEASRSDRSIYIVLTMRSDFLGDCSQFRDLPERINDSQFLVPRMRREQRQRAIEGPVAVGGGEISGRLVQRLLNDVGDSPDQLPILQHALMRTWNKWEEEGAIGFIDLQHYEAIGGMDAALSQHGDEIYDELPDDRSRRIVEILFKRLTDRSRDTRGVRRPTSLEELMAVTKASREALIRVIDDFRQPGRSLLMPPQDSEMRDDTKIDISHESLMRVWKRLKQWVKEEAESAKTYTRLAETAVLHRQNRASLFREADLQTALEWKDKVSPVKPWAVRYHAAFDTAMDFLEKSRREAVEERRKEAERQERELEQAKTLAEEQRLRAEEQQKLAETQRLRAEEQQQRAEDQAKEARRLRWLVGLLTLFMLIATGAAFIAWNQGNTITELYEDLEGRTIELEDQRNLAQQREQAARDSEQRAQVSERDALENARQVIIYADRLENMVEDLAAANAAATQSAEQERLAREFAQLKQQEAERSQQQAEELADVAVDATAQATQQLLQSLGLKLTTKVTEELEARENDVAALLAREAYLFDTRTGSKNRNQVYEALRRTIEALSGDNTVSRVTLHGTGIRAVDYSLTGWIAAGDDNGDLLLLDPTGRSFSVPAHEGWVENVVFSADGTRLGTSGRDGTIKLWQIQTGHPPGLIQLPPGFETVAPIALDRALVSNPLNAQWVAARSRTTLDAIATTLGEQIMSVAYTSNTEGMVIRISNGDLVFFGDLINSADVYLPLANVHDGNPSDITFDASNTLLATAGFNFEIQIRRWPINVTSAYSTLKGHSGQVNALSFSPDSQTAVSASSDNSIRLWDITEARKGTVILNGHTSWVRAVAFSHDGTSLVSGSRNGEIRVWNIDAESLVEEICRLTTTNLDEQQWSDFIEAEEISYNEYYKPCTD